jgi:3-methyladenine DNA glycosylase AlkD
VGVPVPDLRKLVRKHKDLPLSATLELLESPLHEVRGLALMMLVSAYDRADEATRTWIYKAYLDNTEHINNWDLVDLSAAQIVGRHLHGSSTTLLVRFARSDDLWERRIAIIATFYFIRQGEFEPTLKIATLLLHDPHDLIHKAVGWMLREVGNRDRAVEENFLKEHCKIMPRTMLRYAIEKFPEPVRKQYLRGDI